MTEAWFAERTATAPPVLRARAERFLAAAPPGPDVSARLAAAGEAALREAIRAGATRAAALDLLAADALITLALLAEAERDPTGLGAAAAALRRAATGPA